ncbi:outer membrane protein assembly factor BamE [Palleronia pelagia]|uniref:Beta-barrel assembly machine subunit BamE n=1 Tax=Palleronia pelagia TaxID=387096 RepID=A0A1H8BHD7_9RHOB|nr:outer membrane protein assembly factor BamE [Palleronia pelagia]SEM82243.1 Beta-barrel assembly machine subunit BamE [Palleronia pelagia]
MAAALRRGIALGLVLALAACTAVYRNHGYVPTDQDLAQLDVGVSTQADVTQAIGRPTSMGVLDDSGWYYVQSRFRNFGWRAPEEIDREVVAVSFNSGGTVSNIERYGLEDGRVVRLSRRVTEANVQGVGFLRQLFGNLGNFNAADFFE